MSWHFEPSQNPKPIDSAFAGPQCWSNSAAANRADCFSLHVQTALGPPTHQPTRSPLLLSAPPPLPSPPRATCAPPVTTSSSAPQRDLRAVGGDGAHSGSGVGGCARGSRYVSSSSLTSTGRGRLPSTHNLLPHRAAVLSLTNLLRTTRQSWWISERSAPGNAATTQPLRAHPRIWLPPSPRAPEVVVACAERRTLRACSDVMSFRPAVTPPSATQPRVIWKGRLIDQRTTRVNAQGGLQLDARDAMSVVQARCFVSNCRCLRVVRRGRR